MIQINSTNGFTHARFVRLILSISLLLAVVLIGGCAGLRDGTGAEWAEAAEEASADFEEKYQEWQEAARNSGDQASEATQAQGEPDSAPAPEAPTAAPEEPQAEQEPAAPTNDGAPEWRRDVGEISIVNGRATFWRRGMTIPTKRNRNARRNPRTGKLEHGHEYIHAWVDTNRGRILYNVMFDRSGARIYSEATGPRLIDKPWPMPLPGEHRWDFVQQGGGLVVLLDGEQIDQRPGVTLRRVTANGRHERECTGEWRQ